MEPIVASLLLSNLTNSGRGSIMKSCMAFPHRKADRGRVPDPPESLARPGSLTPAVRAPLKVQNIKKAKQEADMRNKARVSVLVVASVVAVGIAAVAHAAPVPMNSLAVTSVLIPSDVEKTRWSYSHGWRGPRPFIGGLILGGAIAAPYYGYPYGYGAPYWGYPYRSSSICREGIWGRAVPCNLP
jgi:hypothetical protein